MKLLTIALTVVLLACGGGNTEVDYKSQFLSQSIPKSQPLKYLPQLVEEDRIIHKGIFSPDLSEFYFTVSNKDFTDFDIKTIHKIGDQWSLPQEAFCNSEYDDHGMSFSPDAKHLYFSSTRPVGFDSIPQTWHIWRSTKVDGKWSSATFIDIPNMRDKLLSHPSITESGELFFHASELDYSNMRIYSSKLVDAAFQDATIVFDGSQDLCTPLVSPKGDYLVYGQIEGHNVCLMISTKNQDGIWQAAKKLMPDEANIGGQGNPYITPDEKFLFFTRTEVLESGDEGNWYINWINTETLIN